MQISNKKRSRMLTVLATAILLVFALCALMPFFSLLISSFKPGQEMIRNGLQFKFDFEN